MRISRLAAIPSGGESSLESQLFSRMTSAGLVAMLALLPAIIFRGYSTGAPPLNGAQIVVYLSFAVALVLRKRLSPAVRAWVLWIGLALLSYSGMFLMGVMASGIIAAPFVVIFAAVVFGRSVAKWTLLAGLVMGSVIALLHVKGIVRASIDTSMFARSPSIWLTLLYVQTALAAWYLFTIDPIFELERGRTVRLDSVLNGLTDALLIHDMETGAILYVNQTMCRLYRCTADEAKRLTVEDISEGQAPYDSAHAKQWMDRAIKEGPQLFEWRAKDRTGRLFWVEVNMRLASMEDGQRLLASVRDISQRKQEEQDLALLKHSIDVHPDAAYWLDENSNIVYLNRAGCEVIGYTREELLGKSLGIVNKLSTPEGMQKVWDVARKQGSFRTETVHCRKDGTTFPVQITTSLIQIGGREYLCGFAQDISDRVRREEESRTLQAQVNHTQRLEAIGTLAGGIAHDFNNILGAIIGYTDLAKVSLPEGSEAAELLANVDRGAQRAGDLVRQILAFSRRTPQDRKPIQLGPVVKEAMKLMRASLPASITLRERFDSTAWVLADVGQIHQIVMNLCTNSGLAMQDHGGILDVSLDDTSVDGNSHKNIGLPPGRYCRLQIVDTGCGIPPEIRDRVFEPFFTTRPVGKGTGLGLSVVHGIVKNAGGAIRLHSDVGKGTTFEILLPVCKEGSASSAEKEEPRRGQERILFVDDEQDLVKVARIGLSGYGYAVSAFSDPQEALTAFREQPNAFDLVITDMTMPGMMGNILAHAVREIRPGIPVLLVSGYSDDFTPEKAHAAGFDGFLDKPLRPSTLAALVRRILDKRRPQ